MPTTNSTGPESIVTSLDCSVKLRNAGWSQDDATFWHHYNSDSDARWIDGSRGTWGIAAPTAEEVLRRLPRTLKIMMDGMLIAFPEGNGKWTVGYEHTASARRGLMMIEATPQEEDTLANAAAAMWIHLKQNNLLPSDK